MNEAPSIEETMALHKALQADIYRTPMLRCMELENVLGGGTEVHGKLEFLQRTGTFKVRGALAVLADLSDAQLKRGVTAVSAGNHAIATAYAAKSAGTDAKLVMIRTASPVRVTACTDLGAEVVLADNVHEAFELVRSIEREEGRYFVHPYEGPKIATGTGTLGLEIHEQLTDFDTVIVAIGGGGLIGGVSSILKQLRPGLNIIGVEPDGADSMHRSFAAGEAQAIDRVDTIADSLGAPTAMPYSYALCRRNVDQLTKVDDRQIRAAMGWLFRRMKFAVEPACAAATAAVLGPLRQQLTGRKVVIVFCGSNIDWQTFEAQASFEDDDGD